jgi:hypothetical protein
VRGVQVTVKERLRLGPPSVTALLFGIWALVITVGFSWRMLSGDSDLARHIVLGSHILRHGIVFPDVFSYTKPGEEFLAYEWMSEVIFTAVHALGGLAAVSVLAGILIAFTIAVIATYLRGRLEAAGVLVVGNAIVVLTYPSWVARPHLFSFLALSLLLFLTGQSPGWKRHLGLLFLFSFWASLHPGFLYGLAVLIAFLVGDSLDRPSRSRVLVNGVSAGAALLGTFATPLGWRLHLNVLEHLRDSRAFQLTGEFQPIVMASPFGAFFFLSFALLIWVLSVRGRRPPLSALLPFLAGLFAALMAVRNVSLFAIFAIPLMLAATSDVVHSRQWKPLEKPRRVMAEDDQRAATWPYVLAVLVVLGALGVNSGRVGPLQVVRGEFSREEFPVEAVARARDGGLHDRRVFSEYHWGGYLLYAWPEQTIYIDGMANFFGSQLMDEYLELYLTIEGWKEALREWEIDLLILPPDVRLAQAARGLPGWSVWYEDETAVVLTYDQPLQELDGP